jgi:folate-binding protein YgfZ
MREMDILCTRFVESQYDALDAQQRVDLDRLLECPDQDILGWFTSGTDPEDPALAALMQRMRASAGDPRATRAAPGAPLRSCCLVSGYSLHRVGGTDAADFLSRQLSCDVAELGPGASVHGAWLTPKGRILALVRLVHHRGEIVMIMDEEVAGAAVQRLRMFVLRSDVSIVPAGDLAVAALSDTSPAHSRAGDAKPLQDVTRALLDDSGERSLLLGTPADLAALDVASDLDEHVWNRKEVLAGAPRLCAASVDAFIPQMLNLDRTGGISFSKGCYPGQEIVARTQHLGRIKRRMYIARAMSAENRIRCGDPVHVADDSNAAVGQVVRTAASAGHDDDPATLLLVVLPLARVQEGARFAVDGTPLESVTIPPYGFGDDG